MNNFANSLKNKNKFLIFGCGFTGSFFAKTIRKFGCTVLTSSRSESKDPNNFVFNSEIDSVPSDKIFDGVVIKLSKNFNNISLHGEDIVIAGGAVLDKSLSESIGKSSVFNVERLNLDLPHINISSVSSSPILSITSDPEGNLLTISKKVIAGTEISHEFSIYSSIL